MARKLSTGAPSSATKGMFWKPEPGATNVKVLVEADEIISGYQFADWSVNPAPIWVAVENDPGYELGLKPRYRAFIPISVEVDGAKEVRLWPVSKQMHANIADIGMAYGKLAGQILSIRRSGTGLETRYTVIPLGKQEKVSEVLPTFEEIAELLGPEDVGGVKALLMERHGASKWEDVVAHYKSDDVETL